MKREMTRQASHPHQASSGHNGKPLMDSAVLDLPAVTASSPRADDQLKQEILRLVEAAHDGHLAERGRTERFDGNNREVLEGVNKMLDAILLPIGEGNRILAQISTGKIDELIAQTYKGDHEKMKQAVNNVGIALQILVAETAMLSKSAADGRLGTRAEAGKHLGDYRKIVEGINQMLDTIVGPLKASAESASVLASSSEELTA
jgi:hypothetical protein